MLKEYLPLIALFISIISLFLSTYNQYFKKPHLKMQIGEWVKLQLGDGGWLEFVVSSTFFNSGAQYGAIYKIRGIISGPVDPLSFRWGAFVETKNIEDDAKGFRPFDVFAGSAETILIPSRTAVFKRIQFFTNTVVEMVSGKYEVEFEVFAGTDIEPTFREKARFTISEQQAAILPSTRGDKQSKLSPLSIRIPITHVD